MSIGIIGFILILIGWVPQVIKTVKEKSGMDLKFAVMYTSGCIFLTIHAVRIDDFVFILLNGGAAILSGIALFYSIDHFKNNKNNNKQE